MSEELSQEELLRRAAYHAKEASRLLDEAFSRHKKAAPDQYWRGLSSPLCIICKQHHPVGMPCPHMMTMS